MPSKMQFIKCLFCVVLYLIICLILLKPNTNLYIINDSITFKRNLTRSSSVLKTRLVNLEARYMKYELENEFVDLQQEIAIPRQVSDICLKYNLSTPLVRRHFLHSSKHKTLYCWIRKVASTSFTKLFSDMHNREVIRDYYREVDILSPQNLTELQFLINCTSIFKFLIVRHPFERLVSSYRNRIEDNTRYTAQAWLYARKIYKLTRPQLFRSNTTTGNSLQKIFTEDRRLKIIPTFREFVDWLLQEPPERNDIHWDQYYTHCALCNISYSFVLKLDKYTLEQINYIFSKLGLDKNQIYLPHLEQNRGGYTNFTQACNYFKSLTYNEVLKLYERYKIDFEMFDYDLVKYMKCASNATRY